MVTTTIADWDQRGVQILGYEQMPPPHRLEALKDKIQPGKVIYIQCVE